MYNELIINALRGLSGAGLTPHVPSVPIERKRLGRLSFRLKKQMRPLPLGCSNQTNQITE